MPQNKGQQLTPQADGTSDRTVSALGALERYPGSPGAFRAVFDPLLE
jgi:hypothetical protein